ncbi:low temperature requirement protein A [Nocardia ignorata]|uniref:Low temperature requirement protein LtrA n=1 Tax=Nocardia ignorata TaxID=145285 RepID=A0A4R6P845_NOCIG|nr:low temperature requirement protein A [Nocardia ignorata]TDP32249.1 low temperature requirement protein LtrA [Nocardia ignorata]
MIGKPRAKFQPVTEGSSVTQLELFFDLVIVFAFTMVTDLAADNTSAVNMLRALLVLALMWWLWIAYSWLGNVVRADEGIARVGIFIAMGGAFLAALTIPEAFVDLPGGWYGPLVFAIAYLVVRLVHVVIFWTVSRDDPKLRGQLLRWALGSITVGTALLVIAATTSGLAQILLWLAAIVGDMVWTAVAGTDWRINSAKHFAERYGLIVIVALGESIVSIGIGVAGLPISWPITVASMLGLTVSGLLWWLYFDVAAISMEEGLANAKGAAQIKIAQFSYTYGHFPMIAGVIALSLGLKKVLYYVGDSSHHQLTDPLYGIPLGALYAGPAVFLLAVVGAKYAAVRQFSTARVLVAALLFALIPVAAQLPALVSLGLLCAILAAPVIWETVHYARRRDEIRHA